jgi:hypothetical protein
VAGEGYLRFVKSYMRRGLQIGWQKNLMTYLLRDKAFRNIFDTAHTGVVNGHNGIPVEPAKEWWQRADEKRQSSAKQGYFSYNSMDDLLSQLLTGFPVSVLILGETHLGCVIRKNSDSESLLVNLRRERFDSLVNDLAYWVWSLDTNGASLFTVPHNNWVCGILLPLLSDTLTYPSNRGDMRYSLIDEEWRELKEDGSIRC